MRYHLFLNLFRKMFKIAKVFSRKLAVPRYMSTSVHIFGCLHYENKYLLENPVPDTGRMQETCSENKHVINLRKTFLIKVRYISV